MRCSDYKQFSVLCQACSVSDVPMCCKNIDDIKIEHEIEKDNINNLSSMVYCVFYIDFINERSVYLLDSIFKSEESAKTYISNKDYSNDYDLQCWELTK